MLVAVIDYGSGNLASAARGLALAAERQGDRKTVIEITSDPQTVARADRIVLPGQGAFADCAAGLAASGLQAALLHRVASGAPFLGICVGMQLMAERGLEHQVTAGFGWVDGDIAKIKGEQLRLPHMGWNELQFAPDSHFLLDGLQPGDHAYFVHSYALDGADAHDVIATTDYGGTLVAMVAKGNRAGTQFHVEKSQEVGLRILGNFLNWNP